ncbi:MAG: 50S ribosomal protein L19 [Rickettsiales bacterium]|nr:50S ribosomal protein L19 [Rickettsiales bacterium]|tara:strand:- start:105 stop:455 length:351 start_codon:yes stop_codon:yes gene_type:complete
MNSKLINDIENSQLKENVPDVNVGDIVVVHKTIVEGKKKRIQKFKGTIIKIQGTSIRKSFTVRKIVEGQGVEKSFLLHSPLVVKVEIIQRSKVRRSKLYYLRDRVGSKANRLKVKG